MTFEAHFKKKTLRTANIQPFIVPINTLDVYFTNQIFWEIHDARRFFLLTLLGIKIFLKVLIAVT